jgi:hypothetical protein
VIDHTGFVMYNDPAATIWRDGSMLELAAVLFAVLGQRDYMAHATVRWQAAEALAAHRDPRDKIDAGFEWEEWYLFDEGLSYMQRTGDYTNAGHPPFSCPNYLTNSTNRLPEMR